MFSRETICKNLPKNTYIIGISEKKSLLYTLQTRFSRHVYIYDFNKVLQRTIIYPNVHIKHRNTLALIVDDDLERVFYQARNRLYIYNLYMNQIIYEMDLGDFKVLKYIIDAENIILGRSIHNYRPITYKYNIYTQEYLLLNYIYINHNKITNEFYFKKDQEQIIYTDSNCLNILKNYKYHFVYEEIIIPYTNHVIYKQDSYYKCRRLSDLSIITIIHLLKDEATINYIL